MNVVLLIVLTQFNAVKIGILKLLNIAPPQKYVVALGAIIRTNTANSVKPVNGIQHRDIDVAPEPMYYSARLLSPISMVSPLFCATCMASLIQCSDQYSNV